MQADTGLVQDIEHPHQVGSDLGGEADALALAPGQGAGCPGQAEIFETHALEKAQAFPDLLEDPLPDLPLPVGETGFQAIEKGQGARHRQPAQGRDVLPSHGHGQAFRLEPVAMAFRAGDFTHVFLELLPHPFAGGFPVPPLEIVQHPFEIGEIFPAAVFHFAGHLDLFAVRAVQDDVNRLFRQVLDGRIQRKAVMGG